MHQEVLILLVDVVLVNQLVVLSVASSTNRTSSSVRVSFFGKMQFLIIFTPISITYNSTSIDLFGPLKNNHSLIKISKWFCHQQLINTRMD